MNLAVLFGLASALCYGAADYMWQGAGRAVGLWRGSFYGSLVGFVALTVWLLLQPASARAAFSTAPSAWGMAIAAAVMLEAASVLLTQGLIRGSLAVVAPVTAGYGAVTTLLSVASGECFTSQVSAGLASTIVGACLVSVPQRWRGGGRRGHLGLGWAIGAALAFGGGFWLQGAYAVPSLGPVLPVWIMYAVGVVLLGIVAFIMRVSLSLPERQAGARVVLASALGVGGFVALTAGFSTGRLAIVVVLSSLTSAITVLLGRTLSDTHVAPHQWLAIGAIVAGLILLRT